MASRGCQRLLDSIEDRKCTVDMVVPILERGTIVRHCPLAIDTRNATANVTENRDNIRKA